MTISSFTGVACASSRISAGDERPDHAERNTRLRRRHRRIWPLGAAAANAAGALGLRTLVVERDLANFERQRAIALDDEALRVIHGLGLFDEVTAHMHLGVTARFVGLDDKPFLSTRSEPTTYTGYPLANFFHQPTLEHALRDGLRRFSIVEVSAGWTAKLVGQDGDGVSLRLGNDDGDRREVRARYVLACDGGSSSLRKQLGIPFAGTSYSEQRTPLNPYAAPADRTTLLLETTTSGERGHPQHCPVHP